MGTELCGQLALPAEFADFTRLGAAMGHRFLAEYVLSSQHCGLAHRHVPPLPGGDDYRVERLLRLEEFAVVLINCGLLQLGAEVLLNVCDLPGVDVADGYDLVPLLQGRTEDLVHATAATQQGQVQFAVGAACGKGSRWHQVRQHGRAQTGRAESF